MLERLAGRVAIPVKNGQKRLKLPPTNREISDSAILEWSRALENHDMETEVHSQRVSEMTVQLARAMGIQESDLVHVRRGALLHDIGKMGIPDYILSKPGKLSEEEWGIMRQHPCHAYQMLTKYPLLHAALDIPYYHHERWDGSGYPLGIEGAKIPLTARVTAIIDVWDALNSDRPYRKAWSPEKATAYIHKQSGKHFDPEIVDVFFQLM